jgi:hypothetical protein
MRAFSRRRTIALVPVAVCSLVFGSAAASAAAGDDGKNASEYVNTQTARLALLVGPWNLTEKHFGADGSVVAQVTGSEEITWVLDDRAIRRTYASGTKASQYKALGLLAWSDRAQAYEGVWLDNASTAGPRRVSGQWDGGTQSFVFTLEVVKADGSRARYKTVEQLTGENQRLATTYLLSGSGQTKVIEVQYKRSRPCPGRLRFIPDQQITGG